MAIAAVVRLLIALVACPWGFGHVGASLGTTAGYAAPSAYDTRDLARANGQVSRPATSAATQISDAREEPASPIIDNQGPTTPSARSNATEAESLNLASEARTNHILNGDSTGGGHQWPGLAGKTPFPESWSGTRIMNEISDVATDPAAWSNAVTQGGRTVLTGMRDGVEIRIIVDSSTGEIISGYPTNLPRKP